MGRGRSAATKILLAEAIEILKAIQPATVRGVAYRLFSAGLISSMEKANTDKVSNLLARAREEEIVPWEWIVDDGRRPQTAGVWSAPQSFAKVVTESFRLDPWEQQAVRVEVWSEKGTVAGILSPVLDEMAVTFRVNRGFTSATAINDMVATSHADRRPLRVLYVGDFDPSGLYMSEMDLPRRLAEYGTREDMELRRIALVVADLDRLEDLSFPVLQKAQDSRFKWYINKTKRSSAWELDAMDPNVLRDRVRAEIATYINTEAWDRVETGERAVRQSLTAVMDGWAALSGGKPGNRPGARA
jgi:hypothetical protein